MDSVKPIRRRSLPATRGQPVPALMGELMRQIRDTFATEDWHGLRQSHFRLMSQVPPQGISVTALADRIGMTKQGCGQFVQQLVESGHLETGTDREDRRVRRVCRTERGNQTMQEVLERIRLIERGWARRVGRDRYTQFRAVLEEIADLD
jgi:DNA-binding MarR family transcriptional regulator